MADDLDPVERRARDGSCPPRSRPPRGLAPMSGSWGAR